jgi:L-alanine-DL-glutamate epimerase-like enolase superfamily enzyme
MKIKQVTAYGVELPQRVRYKMSVANYESLRTVIVEIRAEDGHIGIGQASITASAYSPYGETLDGAVHAINGVLGPQLVGLDPMAIEAAHVAMHKVLQGNPTAKTAIDVALHDLSGVILGVPVYSLLGGPLLTELPVLASIGYFPTDELVDHAQKAVDQGYGTIKIRVGVDIETDVRNLTALRKKLGDAFPISIDFNQAMTEVHGRPDQAIGYIRRLEQFNIDTIEQPVAGYDFENMAAITAAIDTPIVADESIWTLQDARRAINMRACDIIKVKIVKTGGLLFARKMAALCEAAGMALVVGHGIAGVVQNAAEAHLAASLPNWKPPGEMNGYLKMAKDVGSPIRFEGGALKLDATPGLGVKLLPEEIKELAVA